MPPVLDRLRDFAEGPRVYLVLIGLIVLGLAARLLLMAVSFGSNDMATWATYANEINEHGLWEIYQRRKLFNHPPLAGWSVASLKTLSGWSHLPFRVVFKLGCLLADCAVMAVLWRYWRQWGRGSAALAVSLFSCNPVSIMLTAHHGNTDPILAAFALLAAFAHWRGLPFVSGLLVAATANVKIVGLLLAPGLFLLCRDPRTMLRFVGGFLIGMIPFLIPMLVIPSVFVRNVFGYESYRWPWGLGALLMRLTSGHRHVLAEPYELFISYGRHLVVLAVLVWGIAGRFARFDPFRATALSLSSFLVFTPGFSIQYLVWIVPSLAATSIRMSLRYAVFGGLFVGLLYATYLTDGFPYRTRHLPPFPSPVWVFGVLAWWTLVAFQWQSLGLLWRRVAGTGRATQDPAQR